jgi:hypothetical protein
MKSDAAVIHDDRLHLSPYPYREVADQGSLSQESNLDRVRESRFGFGTSRRKFLVALLIVLAFLVPLWPGFEEPATAMDEGSLLVYPELILKGQLPYRDFETFYGPANLWVLSAAYAGFGPSIFVERGVGLICRILVLLIIFALVQRWSTTIAAGCTLLSGIILLPMGIAAYAWIDGIVCVLASLYLVANSESRTRCFWGGILAGWALLFRADLGPAVIVSILPLFFLMMPAQRWSYLGGTILGLLPLGWLTLAVGPREIINNLFLYPVLYSSPARHLPILWVSRHLLWLFLLHLIAVAVNLVAGFIAFRENRRDRTARLLLGLALLGLGVTHQAAQRLDLVHVLYAAFVSLGILPLSIFLIQSHFRVAVGRRVDALFATAIALILVGMVVPEFAVAARKQVLKGLTGENTKTVFIAQSGRSFPMSSVQTALDLGKIFDRLGALAKPGERLFVGPADLRRTNYNDTFIYYMMPQLRPATYFLEMNPQSANRPGSRLGEDIASANWLVLNHEFDTWNEPNQSAKFASDVPMQVVRDQFELCGQYGTRDLYRRRVRPTSNSNSIR